MATIGTLNTDLSVTLGRSDFDSQTFQQINNLTLSQFKTDIAPTLEERRATITNTANQNVWALPSDVLLVQSVNVDARDAEMQLAPINIVEVRAEQQQNGAPQIFAVRNNELVCAPHPGSSTHTLTLNYVKVLDSAIDSDSTNAITTTFRHMWYYLSNKFAREFTQDMAMAAYFSQQYRIQLGSFNTLQNRIRIGANNFSSQNVQRRVP